MQNIATKNNLIVLLLLGLAGSLIAYMSWQGEIIGLMGDEAIYIVFADYFSPYSQELRQGAAYIANHGLYPPGYPVFLALFGADSYHLYCAHVLTTLVILAGLWASTRYLYLGNGAFALPIIYVTMIFFLPRTLLQNLELLSEPLYLFFSILALAKYEALTENRSVGGVYWIAILVCLAALTRTAGITLLFAFVIWQCTNSGKNRIWGAVLVAIVPLLAWELLKTSIYSQQPMSYSQILVNAYPWRDVPALLQVLGHHLSDLWLGWQMYIDVRAESSSLPAAILLATCTLPILLARLAHFRLDAIYFVSYIAMILVWPYADHTPRFLYPIIPLVFFYVMHTIAWLCNKRWRPYAHGLVLAITLLAAIPSTAQILYKAIRSDELNFGAFGKTRALYENTNSLSSIETGFRILQELVNAMKIAGRIVPEHECVYSAHYEMFMYYGKRYARPPTVAGLASVSSSKTPECRYLLVSWSNSHRHFRPGYPLDQATLNYEVLYTHWMRLPNMPAGEKGMVAQLLLLLPLPTERTSVPALGEK